MKELLKILKALSDSNRMRIISMLKERELCVCEITDILQLATSTVSKHLSLLKEAGLIEDEKEGKWVNYRLNKERSAMIDDCLALINKHTEHDIELLNDKLKLLITDRNMICAG
jgi:ArsR family transcriptional regulator